MNHDGLPKDVNFSNSVGIVPVNPLLLETSSSIKFVMAPNDHGRGLPLLPVYLVALPITSFSLKRIRSRFVRASPIDVQWIALSTPLSSRCFRLDNERSISPRSLIVTRESVGGVDDSDLRSFRRTNVSNADSPDISNVNSPPSRS